MALGEQTGTEGLTLLIPDQVEKGSENISWRTRLPGSCTWSRFCEHRERHGLDIAACSRGLGPSDGLFPVHALLKTNGLEAGPGLVTGLESSGPSPYASNGMLSTKVGGRI